MRGVWGVVRLRLRFGAGGSSLQEREIDTWVTTDLRRSPTGFILLIYISARQQQESHTTRGQTTDNRGQRPETRDQRPEIRWQVEDGQPSLALMTSNVLEWLCDWDWDTLAG
jgi:hypothetical protein